MIIGIRHRLIPPIATDVATAWSVCMCVSSVTLLHHAKAVGRNDIPFGRDTRVVQNNIIIIVVVVVVVVVGRRHCCCCCCCLDLC